MRILVGVASQKGRFLHKGICAHMGRASSGPGGVLSSWRDKWVGLKRMKRSLPDEGWGQEAHFRNMQSLEA